MLIKGYFGALIFQEIEFFEHVKYNANTTFDFKNWNSCKKYSYFNDWKNASNFFGC